MDNSFILPNEQPNGVKHNARQVEDGNVGVYVWKMPNGKILANTDNLILNVPAVKGDLRAMAEIARAARYVGFPDGTAEFWEAHRCTEEEYEEQIYDLMEGRLPIGGARR